MPLNIDAKKNIIRKVISNQDYRDEVLVIIDEIFLDYCIDFFKKVVQAKIDYLGTETDWYKSVFLNPDLPKNQLAINSGLNMKSITNAHNSSSREIVIRESNLNYTRLSETINDLVNKDKELQIKLTIRFKDVSVDLSVTESLIIINTIAVKRAEIRGGMWSAVGKQIEKPLMVTLCKLYNVPFEFHNQADNPDSFREVDFYVLSADGKKLRTDKLSDKNKEQQITASLKECRIYTGFQKRNSVDK